MKNKDLFANLTLNQTVKFIHMMVSVPKTTASNNEGDLFVVKKKKYRNAGVNGPGWPAAEAAQGGGHEKTEWWRKLLQCVCMNGEKSSQFAPSREHGKESRSSNRDIGQRDAIQFSKSRVCSEGPSGPNKAGRNQLHGHTEQWDLGRGFGMQPKNGPKELLHSCS